MIIEQLQRYIDHSYGVAVEFLKKFGTITTEIVLKLCFCLLLFSVIRIVFKKIINAYYNSKSFTALELTLQTFLRSIIRFLFYFLLLLLMLVIIGVHTASIIAILGTLGLGLSLAMRDYIANFAAGIILLFARTYHVGDEVTLDGETGIIKKIDIFLTVIERFDGTIVMIPNGQVLSGKIINYNSSPMRRVEITIGVDYSTDIDAARSILETYLKEHPLILQAKHNYVFVEEYADSSINLRIRAWVANEDYWSAVKDISNTLKKVLDAHNISIPFPQLDVHTK